MKLFDHAIAKNLLPIDGESYYHGSILPYDATSNYFELLQQNIDWRRDELLLFGKKIMTKRKVAWYGDLPFEYTYSNTTKQALPWTHELLELKNIVELNTRTQYNSCLLNLYHNGTEGMSWHSDDEPMLEKNASIASLSLGVARRFAFKHKELKEKVVVTLENGSLLEMKGTTQQYWNHALLKSTKILEPRINLTFRRINHS